MVYKPAPGASLAPAGAAVKPRHLDRENEKGPDSPDPFRGCGVLEVGAGAAWTLCA